MNPLLRVPYALAGAFAQSLTYVVPPGQSKLQRGLTARRGILHRYRAWAADHRDQSRQLVWFHAPSVGEGLQASPVISLLRARCPDVQIAYTHYSPSAQTFAQSLAADFADYLPFDTFAAAAAAIAALSPSVLIFSKLDVWPALTETAARRKVRTGLISATLPQASGRRGFIARYALGDAYRSLERVGAISEEDATRLREQGVRSGAITVTGDTRYDQVWARAHAPAAQIAESLRAETPTLVAGSTWPADESRLLPAWIEVRRAIPTARLIIAPHELNAPHLTSLSNWAAAHGLSVARLSEDPTPEMDVVLVDSYGILGDLYALADVAFVGGGFHEAGLHSVLEPAAFGAPVLFGPRHSKSREARALLRSRGAYVANSAENLARRITELLSSNEARGSSGSAARAMVESGLGAAERSFQIVRELLGR